MKLSDFAMKDLQLDLSEWRGMNKYEHGSGLYKFRPHKFAHFYDRIFTPYKDKPVNICEVGISGGWSLLLWDRYFTHPDCHIVGIDPLHEMAKDASWEDREGHKSLIRVEMFEDVRKMYSPRVETLLIDAYEQTTLQKFADESFDIVLDDGSHKTEDKHFFLMEYWRKVKLGGWLIIEDFFGDRDGPVLQSVFANYNAGADFDNILIYSGHAEDKRIFPEHNTPEGLICIQKKDTPE